MADPATAPLLGHAGAQDASSNGSSSSSSSNIIINKNAPGSTSTTTASSSSSNSSSHAVYGGLDKEDLDLSPAITTVAFNPILPPLRIPVPAGLEDEPEKGPFLLAFQDEEAWRRAWMLCEDKFARQCELGGRMGCSLKASEVCSIGWWSRAFSAASEEELEKRREECEEREMMACLAQTKEQCLDHASRKCSLCFQNQLIARRLSLIQPQFLDRRTRRMLIRAARENQLQEKAFQAAERSPGVRLAQQAKEMMAATSSNRIEDPGTEVHYFSNVRSTKGLPKGGNTGSWMDSQNGSVEENWGGVGAVAEGWEGGLINPKASKMKGLNSADGQTGEVPSAEKELRVDDANPFERFLKATSSGVRHLVSAFHNRVSDKSVLPYEKSKIVGNTIEISDAISVTVTVRRS